MKRNIVKTISAILLLVFMFSGSFSLLVYALEYYDYEESAPPYDENAVYYHDDMNDPTDCFTITYLNTPNTPKSIEAHIYLSDINEKQKTWNDQYCNMCFPSAIKLSESTQMYNCHSYAWYSQCVESNNYWINTPEMFYLDYSYCTVSSPQIGDIICYFDDMGTETKSDDINRHSGIVTSVLSGTSNNLCENADLVTVTSKWGSYGLYSHNGLDCPYPTCSGGDADYVKYYRSVHNYEYEIVNDIYHTATCRECGHSKNAAHDYSEIV